MLYCPWVLVAMETHFHVFMLSYQYFEKFLEGTLFIKNLLQLSHNMFCKNIARLTVAREHHRDVTHS